MSSPPHLGLCYILPMAALAFIYLRIFFAAHRNSRSMRKTSVATAAAAAAAASSSAAAAQAPPAPTFVGADQTQPSR